MQCRCLFKIWPAKRCSAKNKTAEEDSCSSMLSRIARAAPKAANLAPRAAPVRGAARCWSSSAAAPSTWARVSLATAGVAAFSAAGLSWANQQSQGAACSGTTETGGQADLAVRVAQLEMDLAGKTNAAFVFIKPHACNEKVAELLRGHFAKRGIRVTSEGTLDAATIDRELLIDTHYGAIASKAVKLSPKELNVPEKGKEGFQKLFGVSWEEALASGKVMNAKEACSAMGVDGNEMEKKWAKLDKSKDMIKFGGGFYCGKVGDLWVINGFYMSMRNTYTTPPAKVDRSEA